MYENVFIAVVTAKLSASHSPKNETESSLYLASNGERINFYCLFPHYNWQFKS
jgi:hypothetical protein